MACEAEQQAYNDALDAVQAAWDAWMACLAGGPSAAEQSSQELSKVVLLQCQTRHTVAMTEHRGLAIVLASLPQ